MSQHRLTFVHVDYPKQGFSQILNLGIMAASGSYIARLDDDDIADPNRLATQVRLLNADPNVVLVAGWANVVDSGGNVCYRIQPESDPGRVLLRQNVICHSTATFRRSTALQAGLYRPGIVGCEDYDLWLRFLSIGEVRVVQQTLVTYLLNPSGMSRDPVTRAVMRDLNRSRRAAQKRYGVPLIQRQFQRRSWEIPQRRANRTSRVLDRVQGE
jgi:glycosyltransferase involved in cell wall biosynthesis